MRTAWLKIRMGLSVVLLFAIIYGLMVFIATVAGVGTPIVYALLAFLIVAGQFFLGPKMVERVMKIKYVSESEAPELHGMVTELAMRAGVPKPKVGISEVPIPNAFAFGTSKGNARVCVTRELMNILNKDELEGVLAHEISHVRHRDMVVITALSAIPMIAYMVYFSFLFSGIFGGGGDDESSIPALAIAIVAFIIYFLTNLVVLYASRIREYYADAGSVELTTKPQALASALYKLTNANARVNKKKVKKEMESMRAFFATDPMKASDEIKNLQDADRDRNGRIDRDELEYFAQRAEIKTTDRIMEFFSTHPNPVSRVKRLGGYL
ncbi:MAG: M48 family metalloprotease [Halobacteriota archaeon]